VQFPEASNSAPARKAESVSTRDNFLRDLKRARKVAPLQQQVAEVADGPGDRGRVTRCPSKLEGLGHQQLRAIEIAATHRDQRLHTDTEGNVQVVAHGTRLGEVLLDEALSTRGR